MSCTRIALVRPRTAASVSCRYMSRPLTENTTMRPNTNAVFSFWPALKRPCGGSRPRRVTAQPSQRTSSSSKRSTSEAVWRRRPPVSLATRMTRPAQNAIAAPRWIDFHSRRLAASSAKTGRYRMSPVASRVRNVTASSQWSERSSGQNRRT